MSRFKWSWTTTVVLMVSLLLMSTTPSHAAKKFPWKPIKVIVALGAGGGNDLNTRAVASVAYTYLGQPMIVKLMPGAGGKIGMNALMKAKNDGHTLMMASTNHLTVGPHVRNMGYDTMKDFEFVFLFTKGDYMLVAMPSQPWKGFQQFVAHAKKNPGKISYGSSGVYGMGHLMILKVMADAGIKLKHIPFKGGGPAYRAGLGGHVDTFGGLPATGGTLGRHRRGQIQILGVASKKRNKLFPNVPTMRENGVDFVLASKRMMIAPKGTPKEHVDILVNGFKKLVNDKTYKSLLKKMGDKPTPLWGEALKKDVAEDYMAYGKIFKSIGLKKKK
jgi:tripartite-type tricarboxylate transporter receptor subunit TctC